MSEDGKHIDIELYMYAHYLQCGHDLDKLINMSEMKKNYYIASMLVMKKQNTENNVALAELTGRLANPFIKKDE
jgi:hypothetical protein